MTNVYDKAHELASAMKDDEIVTAYRDAVKKIEQEEAKKKMIEDFRTIQFEAYQDKQSKGEVSEETKKRLENLVAIIQLNPEIMDFLEVEQKFSILFDDIMKILNEAIGIDIIG
ncbi:MAG: YlbF family regulator [Clostridiaceae bacterium]